MPFERAERLKKLPPYLFLETDRKKRELLRQGKDVINLGVGDPDLPTPAFIADALKAALSESNVNRYPLDNGSEEFRSAIARWYARRGAPGLDPSSEIYPLVGSKEGIAHLPLAMVNPGEVVLIPDPGYPPMRSGTLFAGAIPYLLPLRRERGFLPDLEAIDPQVLKLARVLWLNYPNNPTGAVATREFYEQAVAFARRHGLLVCHDAAYSEMYYDQRPASFFSVEGAKEVGVEFHSLSKTYSMCGWRVGWVAGHADVVAALGALKSNLDSGVFMAIQRAGAIALDRGDAEIDALRAIYRRRRDVFCGGLARAGLDVQPPPATFYVWTPVPAGMTSLAFCTLLLEKAHVVVTPGHGFGAPGEGFFRVSLTTSEDRLAQAVERIRGVL
ncbi:MAG: LL-diaminopimelate aminotransferase [Planctomycetes bacterium]|nr:LL-diaminopimelate aminotransferase [Planctomycetota bacterium]